MGRGGALPSLLAGFTLARLCGPGAAGRRCCSISSAARCGAPIWFAGDWSDVVVLLNGGRAAATSAMAARICWVAPVSCSSVADRDSPLGVGVCSAWWRSVWRPMVPGAPRCSAGRRGAGLHRLVTSSPPIGMLQSARVAKLLGLQMATVDAACSHTGGSRGRVGGAPLSCCRRRWALVRRGDELHGFAVAAMDAVSSHPGGPWLGGGRLPSSSSMFFLFVIRRKSWG